MDANYQRASLVKAKNFGISRLKGTEIIPHLERLAKLRISVFKEYPYCYDGDMQYEQKYLARYAECNESIILLASIDDEVVGASTAIPLIFETDAFKEPYLEENIREIFYLGESVILPEYRGNHLYQHFFRLREEAARMYGCKRTAFCAVERARDTTKITENYRRLDLVWSHFKYKKNIARKTQFSWKDIGEANETFKDMIFWEKNLEEA